jgi:hypothetical protein
MHLSHDFCYLFLYHTLVSKKTKNGTVVRIQIVIVDIATMLHEKVIMVHRIMVAPDRIISIVLFTDNGNVWR